MPLVNLTGHDVTIIDWQNDQRTLEPDGYLRVFSDTTQVGWVEHDGIRVPHVEISKQTLDAPPVRRGTLYIVSGIAASIAAISENRTDFIVPARVVRVDGGIQGCRAFSRMKV